MDDSDTYMYDSDTDDGDTGDGDTDDGDTDDGDTDDGDDAVREVGMCFELPIQLIGVPPPDPLPHLRFRLMPDVHDRMNHWTGSNLFEKWSRHRYEFWHGTDQTPETREGI